MNRIEISNDGDGVDSDVVCCQMFDDCCPRLCVVRKERCIDVEEGV